MKALQQAKQTDKQETKATATTAAWGPLAHNSRSSMPFQKGTRAAAEQAAGAAALLLPAAAGASTWAVLWPLCL